MGLRVGAELHPTRETEILQTRPAQRPEPPHPAERTCALSVHEVRRDEECAGQVEPVEDRPSDLEEVRIRIVECDHCDLAVDLALPQGLGRRRQMKNPCLFSEFLENPYEELDWNVDWRARSGADQMKGEDRDPWPTVGDQPL